MLYSLGNLQRERGKGRDKIKHKKNHLINNRKWIINFKKEAIY